jgi:hypothetical protein
MAVGIVCILLGGVAYSLFNWQKVDGTRSAPVNKSVPQIASGWDYRPRAAIRRYTAIQRAAAETAEILGSSARNENDYVWFNALECSANTFIDPSADIVGAHDECVPVANPETVCPEGGVDDAAVSTYDQSPIDERTALRHDGHYSRPITLKNEEIIT